MKTLDEIIKRQDYVRANKELVKRAHELAEIFADKFDELVGAWNSRTDEFPPHVVKVNGHQYLAKCNIMIHGYNEWYTDGIRFVRYYDDTYYSNKESCKCLNHEDFGVEASYDEYVDFLNDAQDILQQLDDKETEMVNDIYNAIERAKLI